jgi:hypothetical protein
MAHTLQFISFKIIEEFLRLYMAFTDTKRLCSFPSTMSKAYICHKAYLCHQLGFVHGLRRRRRRPGPSDQHEGTGKVAILCRVRQQRGLVARDCVCSSSVFLMPSRSGVLSYALEGVSWWYILYSTANNTLGYEPVGLAGARVCCCCCYHGRQAWSLVQWMTEYLADSRQNKK